MQCSDCSMLWKQASYIIFAAEVRSVTSTPSANVNKALAAAELRQHLEQILI